MVVGECVGQGRFYVRSLRLPRLAVGGTDVVVVEIERQAGRSYDKARYQQFIEAVRKAVAERVPASVAVASADGEEQLWVQGSDAWAAYTLTQDRPKRASIRGTHQPGTDGIANDALLAALDTLRNEAMAKAGSLRDSRIEAPGSAPKTSRTRSTQTAALSKPRQPSKKHRTGSNKPAPKPRRRPLELNRALRQPDATRPDETTALAAALLATGHGAYCR